MYASMRKYVLMAYMQRRITESTVFLCKQQLNTVLLVRDEPFTAPPTVRGIYLSRTHRSSDTTLTVSLYLLTLLSFSLAFEALISE